ncbi:DNA cytosine methyltransferase [Hymenobacter antarcticus]|uniref:Cytosine-specific methyltransferase n=1 Tax=Hymenobacter antarcticus TaxID=486270 RepID=A0ABP7PKZ7_9BACT
MAKLSVVDFFAGAGGFSEGFRMAGYDVRACLEHDKWAADTLRHNHGKSTRVIQEDIREFKVANTMRSATGTTQPDVIIGGPPCQGFSNAGPAKDPNDPRNTLFLNFASWVNALQPDVFVMENVSGILTRKNAQGEKVIDIIKAQFQEKYHVQVWKLNAANFGVPQMRHRVFIVGSLYGPLGPPKQQHFTVARQNELDLEPLKPAITVWQALSDLPQIQAGEGSERQSYGRLSQPLTEYQQWARGDNKVLYNHAAMHHHPRVVERFRQIQAGTKIEDMDELYRVRERSNSVQLSEAAYHSNHRHLRPDMISHTIPASFYSTFIHPMQPRNLTAREAARLQSFPDSYCFQGKRTQVSSKLLARRGREAEDYLSQYNQIGNAVPPLMAKAIAEHVQAHINAARNRTKKTIKPSKVVADAAILQPVGML